MTILFQNGKERRKELAKAISEVLSLPMDYKGAPTFDYSIGGFTVHRNGEIETDEFTDAKVVGQLVVGLRAKRFEQIGNAWEETETPPADETLQACMKTQSADNICLSFPRDGISDAETERLQKLIDGKGELIKLALDTDTLQTEFDHDVLRFTWLAGTAPHELIDATAYLIAALIKLARKLHRVSLTPTETDNLKYSFRCFLLRLGFIGDEYREVRKALMAGIPGNGARRVPKQSTPVDSKA